jgi:hypothetical protein
VVGSVSVSPGGGLTSGKAFAFSLPRGATFEGLLAISLKLNQGAKYNGCDEAKGSAGS